MTDHRRAQRPVQQLMEVFKTNFNKINHKNNAEKSRSSLVQENELLKKKVDDLTFQNEEYRKKIQELENFIAGNTAIVIQNNENEKKKHKESVSEEEVEEITVMSNSAEMASDFWSGNFQIEYEEETVTMSEDEVEEITFMSSPSAKASKVWSKSLEQTKETEDAMAEKMRSAMMLQSRRDKCDEELWSSGIWSSSLFDEEKVEHEEDTKVLPSFLKRASMWSSVWTDNHIDEDAFSLSLKSNQSVVSSLANESSLRRSQDYVADDSSSSQFCATFRDESNDNCVNDSESELREFYHSNRISAVDTCH